jgi:ATP/maltotriose-dependent transcriptional regulator MalT/DNA-binding SARP family transcriptional activator
MDRNRTLILSRVNIPRRRADIISRARLIGLLNDVVEKKLVLVSAPAGYGKTSLFVDFATSSSMPICWYSIDKLDQNPQRFISYVTKAIQIRFNGFGHSTQSVLEGGQGQFDVDFATTVFLNDLHEQVSEHFILLLDDYHLVNDNIDIRKFINRLLLEMEENVHIVIISRSLLSIPVLPLMVARAEVAGISFAELAFQADEIQNLYSQNQSMELSLHDAKDIQQNTEGWITGIVLSGEVNKNEQQVRARLSRVSSFGLENYFLHLIDNLGTELRSFVLWSSLLEEFDANLCNLVISPVLLVDQIPWQKWINEIQKNNLFVFTVGEKGDWVRYHPLFLEFLQSHVYLEFPLESKKIEQQLAKLCIQQTEYERAYSILSRTNTNDELAVYIETVGHQMLIDGRISTVTAWIESLPIELIQIHPFLIALKGYITVSQGDKSLAKLLYDQAINAFSDDDTEFLAKSLAMRANNNRLIGNLDAAIEDANKCNAIIQSNLGLRNIRGDVLRCIGLCYFHKGNLNQALNYLEDALKVLQSADDRKNEAIVQMEIGLVFENLGDYSNAKDGYLKALFYWEQAENPLWLANLLNNLGVLYQLMGDYENAILSFEKAIGHSKATGYTRMESFIITGIADIFVELQVYDEALIGYDKALKLATEAEEHFLQTYILVQKAALYSLVGRVEDGYKEIEAAKSIVSLSNSDMENALCNLEFGGLKLMEGCVVESIPLLEESLNYFDNEGHKVQKDRAHFYLTIAYMQLNQPDKLIEHVLQILSNTNNDHPSAGLVAMGVRYYSYIKTANIGHIQDLLAAYFDQINLFQARLPKLRKFLRENSRAIAFLPPTINIRSLGKMQVRISDHLISNAEWQTQAAKDLFFTLLAHPEGMTKEEISVMFWPDADQNDAKFRFKNTIYRLRRAVGKESILLEQDFYRFNNKLDYEHDIELFLKGIACASRETDQSEKIRYLKNAVQQYGGKYLPEIEENWVYSLRETLHQNFISSLLQLSETYLELTDYNNALGYCQQAIDEDNLLEDSYRLAFKIYAAMGNKAGLVRQYNACVDILNREICAAPSKQTESLFQNLIN